MNVFENSLLRRTALAAFAGCFVLGMAGCNGCNSSATPAPITSGQNTDNGQDPALANMDPSYNAPEGAATTGQPTQVLGQSQSYSNTQSEESYPADQEYAVTDYNQGVDETPVYADQAPPPLPEYDQPPAPEPNDIWTPGYWAWGTGGYYWVPGAWVAAPYYGALWTPPYWGWYGHHYYFHHGYWGPHVGFYGGIDYGFGYIGTGFWGGYWNHDHFWYNREVTRIGPGLGAWGYSRPVIYNNITYRMQPTVRVAYNGGPGGINRAPARFEVAAMHERHEGPLAVQTMNHQAAMQNRAQFFNANHGRPAEFAAARPLGNVTAIRPTPANVHPGRPGFNGQPGGPHEAPGVQGRPGMPGEQRGVMGHEQPGPMNRPGMPGGQGGFRPNPATPMNRPGMPGGQGGARPGENTFEHNNPQHMQMNRVAPQPMHQAPAARPEPQQMHQAPVERQAPQMHAQPQQMHQAPQPMHEAPQMHQAPQMREAPQMHQAPAPQMHEAPRAPAPQMHEAPHAAPQMHAAPAPAPHPAGGGGGGHPGGGGHHR